MVNLIFSSCCFLDIALTKNINVLFLFLFFLCAAVLLLEHANACCRVRAQVAVSPASPHYVPQHPPHLAPHLPHLPHHLPALASPGDHLGLAQLAGAGPPLGLGGKKRQRESSEEVLLVH